MIKCCCDQYLTLIYVIIRSGTGQWKDRHDVMKMCLKNLKIHNKDVCYRPIDMDKNGVKHKEFLKLLVEYPFVACVHGGGIDPSPKAWEALLLGECL